MYNNSRDTWYCYSNKYKQYLSFSIAFQNSTAVYPELTNTYVEITHVNLKRLAPAKNP